MATTANREDAVLELLLEALPYLRHGLERKSAQILAHLVQERLGLAAVAVLSRDTVLAVSGQADQLGGYLVVPLRADDETLGTLRLYHHAEHRIDDQDHHTATVLARLLGAYLELADMPQDRIALEDDRTTVFARVSQIRFVEARGHLVDVALYERRLRYRGTLAQCETRLQRYGFVRVHRSYLANPRYVIAAKPLQSGLYVLYVDDRALSQIPVSRQHAHHVRRALSVVTSN